LKLSAAKVGSICHTLLFCLLLEFLTAAVERRSGRGSWPVSGVRRTPMSRDVNHLTETYQRR